MVEMADFSARFERLGILLKPDESMNDGLGVLNPGCARLRAGTLQLYPRMVALGNISRIGCFRVVDKPDGTCVAEQTGYALEPSMPYEWRDQPGGYGCEDPRVTFVAALDRYVMAYTAFGPQGPQVAVAVSTDGLTWDRLGLMRLQHGDEVCADKDAAFFPEPVRSPAGVTSIAFHHRPTRYLTDLREQIWVGYVPLEAAKESIGDLCSVAESFPLELPAASWGTVKVGGGTPPVRVREGWLSVIHGVDELSGFSGTMSLRYCAGIIIHDAERLDRIVYRSPTPLIVPEVEGELIGTVGQVVFPTGIDGREERVFDIYYGMADYQIGRGRLTLSP
jgi:predicted GH43/DUF377 family glycosyl hydrolase